MNAQDISLTSLTTEDQKKLCNLWPDVKAGLVLLAGIIKKPSMKSSIKSFGEFKQQLETNTDLQSKFRETPVKAIQQFEQTDPVYTRDKWIYRSVDFVLGLIIVSIVGSSRQATDIDKLVPTLLTATCSAALGALTGLLAPSPRTSQR